jgi:4-amino-4-deoxychorismate lyase
MLLINGQPGDSVAVSDRSFQYGDGCFTTMRCNAGAIRHWPLHIERMQACLDLLAIASPDWGQVEAWLKQVMLPDEVSGLKLHISRGSGGRGYSPAGANAPVVTVNAFAFPEHYQAWRKQGVTLGLCQQRLGLSPMLAGHKHNNRLEQVLLKAEADKLGVQDALVCDTRGYLVETTMANLFWVKGGVLYTPDLSQSGVAGVMRRLVIDQAQQTGLPLQCAGYQPSQLSDADELFMTNSLLGVAPVSAINEQTYPVGPITRSLQETFNS